MHHINLDKQGEEVKDFFRSLPTDREGAILEVNGHVFARLVPVSALENGESESESRWTAQKQARRCFLVDREIDGTLVPEEASELANLQQQMRQHLDRVAPLPLEGTRRLYESLVEKAPEVSERMERVRQLRESFAEWNEEDAKLSNEEADRLHVALEQNRGLQFRLPDLG